MQSETTRVLGAGTALGAALAVITAIPSRWYGAPTTDAYVFDPATFSPLWVQRTLVPVTTVLAVALLTGGVAGLVLRDRAVAGRARRWGGASAVGGLGLVAVTTVTLAAAEGGRSTAGMDSLLVVVGLLIALVGAPLALAGLVAAGVGYARTPRPRVGYALVAGPSIAAAAAVAGLAGLLPTWVGFLPSSVPFAATFAVVGWELWTHPEPLDRLAPTDGEGDAAPSPDEDENGS